ncbi:MAG: hypothetical protein V2I97_19400 [Desulfococcaceae bacterium]|jgi:hypothetical protein|nr:hypothetical protein [Desulfococcaceae bacterium]
MKIPSESKIFSHYQEFESFCKSLFRLKKWEYKKLYQVMIKLESVGKNPIRSMILWKNSLPEQECLDFIRFMILVDESDMIFDNPAR